MKKKSKNSDVLTRAFFKALGPQRTKALLGFMLKKKISSFSVSFPIDVPSTKDILIILPEDPLQVLYQLRSVITLTQIFKHAGITLLCEKSAAPYAKMLPGLNVIEYDSEDCNNFASEFRSLTQELKGNPDICFLLEKNPNPAMLYLTCVTAAPIRVGYYGAGNYPFLNLHFRPNDGKRYLPEINNSLVTLFGESHNKRVRWSVARKTIEEIDQLIKESRVPKNSKIIGLEPLWFIRNFGESWTEELIGMIRPLCNGSLYIYTEGEPRDNEIQWLKQQDLPVFSQLSALRTAALVSRSELVITGNTVLYALAGLLDKPAIGLFDENEIDTYCPQTSALKGISYNKTPDQSTINRIASVAMGLLHNG